MLRTNEDFGECESCRFTDDLCPVCRCCPDCCECDGQPHSEADSSPWPLSRREQERLWEADWMED
jgi:hypothetical protein